MPVRILLTALWLQTLPLTAQFFWVGGSGEYADGGNWSSGAVPAASDEAVIGQGTAEITGTDTFFERAAATMLDGGHLILNNLRFLNARGLPATFTVTEGGLLHEGTYFIIGNTASGTFVQDGGTVQTEVSRGFFISDGGGDSSEYRLNGGSLSVNLSGTYTTDLNNVWIGRGGQEDRFRVEGGDAVFSNTGVVPAERRLYLSRDGQLEVTDGSLELENFESVVVGHPRSGAHGTPEFVLTGGQTVLELRDAFIVGGGLNGRLRISGGDLELAAIEGSGGNLRIGDAAGITSALVEQSGGSVSVAGDVVLGANAEAAGSVFHLSGGSLAVSSLAAGPAPDSVFVYTGGSITLLGDAREVLNASWFKAGPGTVAVFVSGTAQTFITQTPGSALLELESTTLLPPEMFTTDTTTFSFRAMDTENSMVELRVDWGDGQGTPWTAPGPSGQLHTFTRRYLYAGEYLVRVQARNHEGVLTGWTLLHSVTVTSAPGVPDGLAGLWAFDNAADLREASVGKPLVIEGSPPLHEASLSDLRSEPVTLEGVIRTAAGTGNHLRAVHAIGANGGGGKTNTFSMVFDVLAPSPSQWHAFFQTDPGNTADADFFMRASGTVDLIGRGGLGYSNQPLPRDRWHRLVLTFDASTQGAVRAYVDGQLFYTYTRPALDSRWALDPLEVLFFADENNENQSMAIGLLALYAHPLSPGEIEALGSAGTSILPEGSPYPPVVVPQPAGPASLTARENQTFTATATDVDARDVSVQFDWGNGQVSPWTDFGPSGEEQSVDYAYPYSGNFPLRIRSRNSENLISDWVLLQEIPVAATPGIRDGLAGLWTFDDPGDIGAATYGSDLTPVGTAPEWIPSRSDWRLRSRTLQNLILTSGGTGNHLRVPHGVGANGYGQKTNVFSLVFDILAPSPRTLWHALYQTTLTNGDDAEYFMSPTDGNLGITALVYSTEPLPRDEWHRVVISVNLGEAGFFRTYVNGELFFEHSPPALDSRWALDPEEVLLFADDNHENQSLAVAAVAVFSKALSADEVALLGDPGVEIRLPPGSPPPIPEWVNPAAQSTVGEWTTFEVSAEDAEHHPVQFQVDWGDGRFSDWTDMLSAGESMVLSHVWIEEGGYSLRVRARNSTGTVSDWSAAHTVTATHTATPKITNGTKVITYNTFAHFGERKRIHETAGWLREQKPDLVALQELSNISEAALGTLARSWGHAHAAVMSETGSTLALTSRFPIENVVRHTGGYHRAILQVRTGGYEVFVVHKSPYNRAERLADLNRIAPVIEALIAGGTSVIVMGDFNAFSEADAGFLSSQTQLLQALPAAHLKEGAFDFDVMNGYFALGLVDSTRIFGMDNITFPTLLRPANRPETEQAWRAERVDYILTDPASAGRSTVFYPRTRLLNFTSDHYPVVAFIADPLHSYYQWADAFPELADLHPEEDPDGDGVKNLLEFILGGNPGIAHSAARPLLNRNLAGILAYEFIRRADSVSVTRQYVQESLDLFHWGDTYEVPTASQGPFEILPAPDHPGKERVRFHVPAAPDALRFFRLRVQMETD